MAITGPVKQAWKFLTEGKVGFDQVLKKVNLISANNGQCTAELTVSEEHTNGAGTLHGGFTSTLVDVISGMALATHRNGERGSSVDLHVTFLSPVPLGEQIVIEAKTNKAGKNLAFLEVLITRKSTGAIVAKGLHTKYVASNLQ